MLGQDAESAADRVGPLVSPQGVPNLLAAHPLLAGVAEKAQQLVGQRIAMTSDCTSRPAGSASVWGSITRTRSPSGPWKAAASMPSGYCAVTEGSAVSPGRPASASSTAARVSD